jgi:branched-chain amino acid transport system permease protein
MRTNLLRVTQNIFPLAGPVAILAVLVLLMSLFGSAADQNEVVGYLIDGIVVVGLYIFIGNSGLVSFGHFAFVAVGAYIAALLTIPSLLLKTQLPTFPKSMQFAVGKDLNPFVVGVVAVVVVVFLALLIGWPIMRLGAFQASIATFAILIIAMVVASNWTDVTGGTGTIIGVPQYATLWSTFIVLVFAMAVAFLYQVSRFGLRLRATRDDDRAATALGVSVVKERWIAFGLSSALAAVAGVMTAFYTPFSSTDFYIEPTFLTIAMLVIGGRGSLIGAVGGVAVVAVIGLVFGHLQSGFEIGSVGIALPSGTTQIFLAVSMLVILIWRPMGIFGARELRLPGRIHAKVQ